MLYAGASRYRDGLQVVLMFQPSPEMHKGAKMGNRHLVELPDHQIATLESLKFREKLHSKGRQTIYLAVNAHCYDGCYTKDNGTSLGWEVDENPLVLTYPMVPRHRKWEVPGFREVLATLRIQPVAIKNKSEGGDVSALALPDDSQHLFVGVRSDDHRRTSKRAVAEMKEIVGRKWNVHTISFDALGDKYLHLDSGANFVGMFDGKPTWLIDPEAYPESAFRDAGFEVIVVAPGDRLVSAYLAEDTLFVPKAKMRTIRKLRRLGFKVKPVSFEHHERADAGVPCITNTLTLPAGWRVP